VHHCHDVTLWSVFSQLGALSPSGEIRPYSRRGDGVLIAEGTGILVLERLADAVRRDHRVYATLAGSGVASDGRHSSLMSPRADGQVLALQRAYAAAGVDPAAVGLLEGHGTATPAGDRAELETIRRIFGDHEQGDAQPPVLGSVKSNIGHAMPAAGAAGLIKAVMAVHEGTLPPTLHADEPHADLAHTRFRLVGEAEAWSHSPGPRRAGVNAFGFGGINAHVIVEQHGAATGVNRPTAPRSRLVSPRAPSDHEFRFDAVVLEGPDARDLASQLAGVSLDSDTDRTRVPSGGGPARIAIVDPTSKRMALAARVLAKGLPWRGRSDIWFEPSGLVSQGGRVAFLLPGLEPSSPGDPTDVAAWFGLGVDAVPEAATGIERHCREMFTVGRLLHRAFGVLGASPDDIAGHSLGEWTGAFTAELIPAALAEGFLDGLEPGGLELPGVVFVAVGCGADVAREVICDLSEVTVSHDNCPHQSVICGTEMGVAEACRRFGERKILAQELPFRSGFHTPFFAPHLDVVRHHWARMPVQETRIPLWSATTCERYPASADAVRQLAVDHLLKPVRFRELIDRMYADGVRVFVQLGVGSLVGFVDDTLKDRPQLSIPAASSTRTGMAQLTRAAIALWVEGVDLSLEHLLSPAASKPRTEVETRSGLTTRLELGAPFVRLPESVSLSLGSVRSDATRVGSPASNGAPTASPAVRAELDALLADTLAASESISAALTSPARGLARAATSTALAEESETTLDVSVESYPWLADHCFYRQPAAWGDLTDRFPVVPITTLLQLLAEAAARQRPGLTVTRIEHVRAMRWLTAAPPTRAVLTTRRRGEHQVDTAIPGYARATVHLAKSRPPSPAPRAAPLRNPRPSPIGPDRLYSDHWMFHGPAFQGVREIAALGDDGIDGAIESLPAPGAWLDNAGQLFGWWLMATADTNFLALPQSIDCIEYFGPQPATGESVLTTVRVVDITPRTVRADIELIWNGAVIVRVTGWVDRRFDSDPTLWLMHREPEHRLLASVTDDGYLAVEERWQDSASRELMARRYLDASERTAYEALNPHDQRLWLLGRIAAKDAVRNALWTDGHGPMFPVEVPLVDDAADAVIVRDGPARGMRIAIARRPWIAVASVDAATIHIEDVHDGDRGAALARLDSQIAAAAAPKSAVHLGVLPSPVHICVGATSDLTSVQPAHGKEYVVARTKPN
jgi:acyl transferase domain-containing protein